MARPARRIAALLALALGLAAAAGGCGDNDAASAHETAGQRAEARAFAESVNLSPADLPGSKIVNEAEEGRPSPLDRGAETCDGGPTADLADRGEFSPLLQRQQTVPVQTVLSGVYRLASPSDATAYLEAADSGGGRRCIEREETRKRASLPPGARGRVQASALRGPLGAPGITGVRVWRCLTGKQPCSTREVRGFTDRLWFSTGPYVVTLFYIAVVAPDEARGSASVALPLERRLIGLLHTRAEQHKP
jgi:hypothetical protein